MGESASAALVAILMGGPPSPSQEKEAIDRFLLQHAQRYDFSSRAAGETFGEVFRLVVARFLLIVAPKGDKRDAAACREQPADLWPRDYLLRVLQCMRVLTRDPAHRSLFSDLGGTEVLVRLFVELSSEHCLHPHAEFASEMLVETLSILKRFASSSTLCPSPVGRCSLADGLHLQRGLVDLLSTREALVLQCVLVAMQQFVQVEPHLRAIGQLGCAEIMLRVLVDYEPSFKARAPSGAPPVGCAQLLRLHGPSAKPPTGRHPPLQALAAELIELLLRERTFLVDVVLHDGTSGAAAVSICPPISRVPCLAGLASNPGRAGTTERVCAGSHIFCVAHGRDGRPARVVALARAPR